MEWKDYTLYQLYEKLKEHYNVKAPEDEDGGCYLDGREWLSLSAIVDLMKDLDY